MREYIFSFIILLCCNTSLQSQAIQQRLAQAVKVFESDSQMRNAIVSLYVADAITGKKVFAHNERFGLAPASTQKIFTSIAAFELLGNNYRYKTDLAYSGKIENGSLQGKLYIISNGDPTLGSWRYADTKEDFLLNNWANAIKTQNITSIGQGISAIASNQNWSPAFIPDGWIWQDIGNYYGAGAGFLNWRENQYDLVLRSGSKTGDSVHIVTTKPKLHNATLQSFVTTGAPGSGDNAYIYLPPFATSGIVRGTIPPNEKAFVISGSFPDPASQLCMTLADKLRENQISVKSFSPNSEKYNSANLKIITTHQSPPLDSMNFYFMRRSINLYGEAFVKTIALEKTGVADTDTGIRVVRDFFKNIGIEKSALQIIDGSGLSPQNRVTTEAEVLALIYARKQPWFRSFYLSLPEYNGMKMKSGSIGGARAYAGYHTARDGKQYVFSIIVNNYKGSASAVVRKMYKVLDVLK
jgi:D-alanyl-D-alanine carboxypeptidase, serine-type, PBP4 family